MKPQFADIRFTSQEHLDKWLCRNTAVIVQFNDNGQDMQKMWVHSTGEILHTDMNSVIYSGRFVSVKTIEVGKPIQIWKETKFEDYLGLIVKEKTEHVCKLQ